MALRLACDLDGTLADMDAALQREAERLYGPGVVLRAPTAWRSRPDDGEPAPVQTGETPQSVVDTRTPLTDRQMRRLWAHVRRIDNFWTTLAEIEAGAVSRLASLASAHRWEVIFLTQRPDTAGETGQLQSQRWLHAHGFPFPSVYVMSGSRGKVADALALDVVIDDRPENCLDVKADSSARSILVWRDDPAHLPAAVARLGITVVHSFAQAIEDLQAMSAARSKGPSLIDRLRSAMRV